jgi:hypothetical protein
VVLGIASSAANAANNPAFSGASGSTTSHVVVAAR